MLDYVGMPTQLGKEQLSCGVAHPIKLVLVNAVKRSSCPDRVSTVSTWALEAS